LNTSENAWNYLARTTFYSKKALKGYARSRYFWSYKTDTPTGASMVLKNSECWRSVPFGHNSI